MLRNRLFLTSSLVAGVAFVVVATGPLAAAESPAGAPAKLVEVAGSPFPRVVLTEQAAKRLSIQTEALREETAKRWMMMNAQVEIASGEPSVNAITETASIAPAGESGQARQSLIKVPVDAASQMLIAVVDDEDDEDETGDHDEFAEIFGVANPADEDKDGLVVVLLTGQGRSGKYYTARPVAVKDRDDGRFFEFLEASSGVKPGDHAFVAMKAPESGSMAKIVPYSSVVYDEHGDSWLYSNPEPLVFVRQKVAVERVLGDIAVLSDGPARGTPVVSVGAVELMGVELKFGGH
ncbi:hypothetical protein [Mesorhizobium sp.]|uniref:hypothetical protein n=1 Tax=Mesorhizobium sp. TaxID=1871066 RepID=UPI000FE50420|nr:hypothetical protein [Mesorhizobium sp.]RWH31022.1 MAG: hypothetical protein EOQ76_10255 [Mesorhizobium sp.]RWH35312.1 MAG: hypothetical protein EOQ79_21875 [Mesorhizobium sp.]RWI21358.1 MAG: hypothetical protein EOQ94_15470 [Mesorhizobium sp.]TIR68296.1 MAG: hypothetical protein E5X24_17060 [Mesorhizobium sp.]